MIIKKIKRRATASTDGSEFAYMNHLSRYIVRADVDELQELVRLSDDDYLRDLARYAVAEGREGKAEAVGGINMLGDSLPKWEAEMAALLHRCSDPAGTIDHWVFSWPEGEKPTIAEMERAFAIFMQCQGLERAKGVWGSHRDTDNPHGHVLSLRVDPVTGERLTGGDGWDIDAAHRAKAVIEAEFPHWKPEARSRYVVRDGMLIENASDRVIGEADDPASWSRHRTKSVTNAKRPASHHPAIDAEALAYEAATGFMSRKRVAIEIAVPIVLSATSLDTAYAELAEQGIELRRERSGAAFVIDGKAVKASIDRRTSHDALVARFKQPLTPSPYSIVDRGPRERWPDDARRRAYYAARRPHDEWLAVTVADVRIALGVSAQSGAVAAALKAAVSRAAFPAFEAWKQGAFPPDPAELVLGAVQLSEVSGAPGPRFDPKPAVLRGYRATHLAGRVIYRSLDKPGSRPAFVDLGDKIFVHAGDDRQAVRASLLLIASRYPENKIAVTGDRAFQRLVLQIADEERIQLDGALGRRQARRTAEVRTQPPPSPVRSVVRVPSQVRAATEQPAPAARPRSPHRALAMLGRVFHDGTWLVSDYWGVAAERSIPKGIPARPRTIDDPPSWPSVPAAPTKPTPADLARRAAIAAAARSR